MALHFSVTRHDVPGILASIKSGTAVDLKDEARS